MKPDTKQKGRSLSVTILIIIGVLAMAEGAYFIYQKSRKPEIQPKGVTLSKPAKKIVTSTSTNTKRTSTPNILDCKQNLNCLIQASKDCRKAKAVFTATVNTFGVKQKTTSFLEIKGKKDNKCIFYLKTEKIALTFPPNVPRNIVNQQKAVYKKLEGREGTCQFKTSDLTAMLARWNKGIFKSGTTSCKLTSSGQVCKTTGGDFGVAQCQGTYFKPLLP